MAAENHTMNTSFTLLFFFCCCFFVLIHSSSVQSSTVAISENSNLTVVCALVSSGDSRSQINCTSFPAGFQIPTPRLPNNASVSGIVGGEGFICAFGSISGDQNNVILCWRFLSDGSNITPRRIHNGPTIHELVAGNTHICGSLNITRELRCWQKKGLDYNSSSVLTSIAVGEGFVCGLQQTGQLKCTGNDTSSGVVSQQPKGAYIGVAAGFGHACAITGTGSLMCWGEAAITDGIPHGQFTSVALGENRGCGLRINGTITCWGKKGLTLPVALEGTYFRSVEAKKDVFCAISVSNYSLFCWGIKALGPTPMVFEKVYPGPCRSECQCQPVPGSSDLCGPGKQICERCSEPSAAPAPASRKPNPWSGERVAFLVMGCAGALSFLMVGCFFLFRLCSVRGRRVHDSGRLDQDSLEINGSTVGRNLTASRRQRQVPVLEKRLSHLISMGAAGGHFEEFPLQLLVQATNNFSDEHKIGSGSFGSVYSATLQDGRELAIKRAEFTASSSVYAGATKRDHQEDKDNAFVNELEFLSRVHHKNLVRLLGFCEDSCERILVYEYMKNGTLHDHLHNLNSVYLTSWTARIKVALDAARGIEYLHVYAVPTIIHRDIKSSNILLDEKWIAKVSDFGLSLIGPSEDVSHLSLHAAGTVGYMDPEYYRLRQLTAKSDVYSFGVVLLELLSGKKAIHKNENGTPRNVVDYVLPYITQDEIHRVLDRNVPPPTPYEIEAVSYVGYLAGDCVTSQGSYRPSMTDVVNSLERALEACSAQPLFSRSSTESST